MSEFVALTAIVAIVSIVAIVFGFVFRAKIGQKGIELDMQPGEERNVKRSTKRKGKVPGD